MMKILWFTLGGMFLLVFLSSVQMFYVQGHDLAFNPNVYVVPVFFGAVSGFVLGLWRVRLQHSIEQLRSSDEQARLFSDFSSNFSFWKAPDGRLLYVSPACLTISGYSQQELMADPGLLERMVHPEDRERWLEHVRNVEQKNNLDSLDFRILTKEQQVRWLQHICVPLFDRRGNFSGTRSSNSDITHRVQMECDLRESEERYLDLLENANDLIQSTLPDGSILFVNRAWREVMGYSVEEIGGLNLQDIIHPESLDHCMTNFRGLLAGRGVNSVEAVFVTKGGRTIQVEGSINCRFFQGQPVSTRGIFRDITQRREAEEKIRRLAYYDSLTHLPNRDLFSDRLGRALSRARRNQQTAAVVFLDLDHFKQVNDSLGHAQGDLLLQEAAQRLSASVRETDTVSRFGGDEFVILISDMGAHSGVMVAVKKILEAFSQPFLLENAELRVTTSIGVALYPDHGMNPETLLKHADSAMYQAKKMGRNTYHLYAPDLDACT